MRRRTKFAIVAAILSIAFIAAVPVVGASSPGPTANTQIHFTESLDCYLLGLRYGQGIGVYYFEGAFGIGCGPLVV
jgi:hypothetical protein